MSSPALVATRTLLATLWASRASRLLAVSAAALLGASALIVWRGWLDPTQLGGLRRGLFIPGLPLAAVVIAELPLRDGLTHRTLLYPLLGPVSRTTLALVRTSIAMVLLAVGLAALVLVLGLLVGVSVDQLPRELLAVALGSACYVGLLGLVHLVSRHGLVAALAVVGLVDYPLSQVPFAIRNLAPATHLQVLAGTDSVETLGLPLVGPATSVVVSATVLAAIAALSLGVTAVRFARMDLEDLC